jgi:AcrR family transcriptional regulator
MSQTQRILEGAFELFMQAGIKSVTMDDIAKHLGMSKKTIYQHFSDKNELVVELVKGKLELDIKDMDNIMAEDGNVIEKMLKMMKCSEDLIARMNPIVMHDMQKYHSDAWKEFQKFKSEKMVQTLVDLLDQGKEQGYIRPEIDTKIMALMRVAQVEIGFNNAIFPFAEFNVWTVQQQFFEHFNYGICTLKGYKLLNEYQNINQE